MKLIKRIKHCRSIEESVIRINVEGIFLSLSLPSFRETSWMKRNEERLNNRAPRRREEGEERTRGAYCIPSAARDRTAIKKFRGTYCGLYRTLLTRETIRVTRALSLANFSNADRGRFAILFANTLHARFRAMVLK